MLSIGTVHGFEISWSVLQARKREREESNSAEMHLLAATNL